MARQPSLLTQSNNAIKSAIHQAETSRTKIITSETRGVLARDTRSMMKQAAKGVFKVPKG